MSARYSIIGGDADYRVAAQMASKNLLVALLRYGARHGIPNLGPQDCLSRLLDHAPREIVRPKPQRGPRPHGYRRKRQDSWTPEQHARAAELRRQGMSYGRIGYEIGRSASAVASRLRDYGGVSSIDGATG